MTRLAASVMVGHEFNGCWNQRWDHVCGYQCWS